MVSINKPNPTSTTDKAVLILPRLPDRLSLGLLLSHSLFLVLSYIVYQAAAGFATAEAALGFYGVYHREPWNQFIHFFGVPCIIWTLFIIQAHLPLTNKIVLGQQQQPLLSLPGIPPHYFSWATLWTVFYAGFYFTIDWFGALLYAPFLYLMYGSAIRLTRRDQLLAKQTSSTSSTGKIEWTGTGKLLQLALLVHVLAWYVQIHPGHKIIEGAQPAIRQSLGGALTSAPLFAFYEGIWWIGLRPALHERVLELVAVNTKALCEAGINMRACAQI